MQLYLTKCYHGAFVHGKNLCDLIKTLTSFLFKVNQSVSIASCTYRFYWEYVITMILVWKTWSSALGTGTLTPTILGILISLNFLLSIVYRNDWLTAKLFLRYPVILSINIYSPMRKLLVSINQSLNTCQILHLHIFWQS